MAKKYKEKNSHDEPAFVKDDANLTRLGRSKKRKKKSNKKALHIFVILQILICLAIAWFFLPGFRNVLKGDFAVFENKQFDVVINPTPTPKPTPDPQPIPTSQIGEPISTVALEPTSEPIPIDGYIALENTYRSENVDIKIEKISEKNVTYYVADIKIKDMSYITTGEFRNSKDQWGRRSVVKTAKLYDAIVAINTDYYTYRDSGIIIRNGKVIINDGWGDVLCIYEDGRMVSVDGLKYSAYELRDLGVVESFTFGPVLIKDGEIIKENLRGNSLKEVKHPRTGIGYYSPGHYLFVTVDGRKEGYSEGMTLTQFANLFASRGCNMAYNLDGGGSTTMAFMGKLVNRPEGTTDHLRDVDGILYIWDDAYPEQ